jgi:hypothetical protein
MQDAQHFRNHAALRLEIAQQMSDRQTAEDLRVSAAQYLEKAAELDHKAEPPVHRHIQGALTDSHSKEICHG